MPRHSLRSLWQPRSTVRPEAATEITGEQEERWQACDTHFHSRTAYFDFLPHGDSRDFTIYAFLHTFSIPILQPDSVPHCYRLSYVWQTPWAESPSKRQMGGNFSISKLLTDDTCHVLKYAGDESSKEVTDFGTDSFLACHSRHQ